MPKTKAQQWTFSILMSLSMIYGMEVYNRAIANHGLSNSTLLVPIYEILLLLPIVVLLQHFIVMPIANKLAPQMLDFKKAKPFMIVLAIQCITVWMMCPTMSLVATILFKGVNSNLISAWLQTLAFNFPMAFFWQIFFAGPIVRFIFDNVLTLYSQPEATKISN